MNLQSFEQSLLALYQYMPLGASFLAGILTFLSPCILPLVPPYISYISGLRIKDLQDTKRKGKQRWHIIQSAILFVCGFSLVFISLGMFASSTLGIIFSTPLVRYIAGIIIIAFGIHFLSPWKFGFLFQNAQINLKYERFGYLAPLVLGIGFSIGWSPCVGPILSSILTLSVVNAKAAFWLMLCYCAGLGLAFIMVAVFIDVSLGLLKKIIPFMKIVELISGILLILIGFLIIMQKTDFLIP